MAPSVTFLLCARCYGISFVRVSTHIIFNIDTDTDKLKFTYNQDIPKLRAISVQ